MSADEPVQLERERLRAELGIVILEETPARLQVRYGAGRVELYLAVPDLTWEEAAARDLDAIEQRGRVYVYAGRA